MTDKSSFTDPYETCPVLETEHFTLRLIEKGDADSLFGCYHDRDAVKLMNDDNCDFGFYTETRGQMARTVDYWLDFFSRRCFIRFAVVDKASATAVGTVEGFGGDDGVLRVDIRSDFERAGYLSELFTVARENFNGIFGNKRLLTKADAEASERRAALSECGWDFIGEFRTYADYFAVGL